MRFFRHLHRATARTLALFLLATTFGAPLAFPHIAEDDLLCLVDAGEPHESRFEAAPAMRTADHCAVCHSQRCFRSARLDAAQAAFVLSSSGRVAPRSAVLSRGPARHRLPARAPPA